MQINLIYSHHKSFWFQIKEPFYYEQQYKYNYYMYDLKHTLKATKLAAANFYQVIVAIIIIFQENY